MVETREGLGRAAGKVILLGEHAVVYGSPAIAVALERGARATARVAQRSRLTLAGKVHELGADSDVSRAFEVLLAELGVASVEAEAHLEIPAGAGLGGSASLGVALARAVISACVPSSAGASVARAALAWENVFHGNASGIDTTVAERAGCVWFTREGGPLSLRLGAPLRVLVAVVEPGASTRRMVEGVAARLAAEPKATERCLRLISEIVERGRDALLAGAISRLGALLSDNHALLRELGVSTPGLDSACQCAIEAGALGAKLTGAGGGGAVIALAEDDRAHEVHAEWQRRGFECLEARA